MASEGLKNKVKAAFKAVHSKVEPSLVATI